MHATLEPHRTSLVAACQQFGVKRLEAFGSALRTDFGEGSDLDLLVLFEPQAQMNAFEQYFGFKEAVEAIVARPVDLIVADAIRNPAFRAEVERFSERLYAA